MAGYTRQSTFADGDTITAALFNNEYNQLLNAFSNTGGHKHDGTANEGPVIGLIGDAGETAPNNKVLIDTTNNYIEFYVQVSDSPVQQLYIADGAIVPVTDNDIDLGTSSLQFKDLYINGTANIDSLVLATGSTVTAVLDEDDLSSDSATSLVTQQSVKAYIDAQVTAQDLDFLGDSGGALSIDLDSESLTIAGGTGLDTVGSGNTVTVNIDATVATLTGSQTLTNKTIDVDNNTVSNIEVDNFKASAIVLESEGIGSNDNDTSLPTSAAVKDYVDTQITAEDLDITTDSGTIAIDLDSETLTVSGGTGLDSSATGNAVTLAIDSTVATLTGTQTLTNKTLTSPDVNTPDIDGGTIDGATIATSDVTVGAGKTLDVSAGTLTLADNQISGDKVEGGTIAATTITDLTFGSLNDGTITATAFVDEDNMASNSATLIPTQQSVKAYVDTTVAATNEVVEDTTPQLGGDLDLNSSDITGTGNINITGTIQSSGNITGTLATAAQPNITSVGTLTGLTTTGDINFGDDDKAIFGAGSDLEIYHTATGNHSIIEETGGGNLVVRTNGSHIEFDKGSTEYMARMIPDGAVELYYDSALKLATTSTGIDVTGTATMDGLTVDGLAEISAQTNGAYALRVGDAAGSSGSVAGIGKIGINPQGAGTFTYTGTEIRATENALADYRARLSFHTRGSTSDVEPLERLRIDQTGDISFYEDTGTSQALFWDASAESLGIGTTSPFAELSIKSASPQIYLETASSGNVQINYNENADQLDVMVNNSAGKITFGTSSTERMRIDASGNVGIGDTSPATKLEILDANGVGLRFGDIASTPSSQTAGYIGMSTSAYSGNNGDLVLIPRTSSVSNILLMEGNVGIGTASPSDLLDISANGTSAMRLSDSSSPATFAQITQANGVLSFNADAGDAQSGSVMKFLIDNSEKVRIDSSNNVGIGTSSPSVLIEGQTSTANSAYLRLGTINSGSSHTVGHDIAGLEFYSGDSSGAGSGVKGSIRYKYGSSSGATTYMSFHTAGISSGNDTERMRITSDGVLQINAVARQTMAEFNNRQNGASIEFGHENNGGQYYGTLGVFGTNGDPYIGFSTDCESSANTFTTRGAAGNIITSTTGSLKFMQVTSASATGQTPVERMRIDSSGNVGIGTSIPAEALTVNGNIGISDGKIYNGAGSNSAGVSLPNSTVRIDGYNGITFHSSSATVGSQTERMRIDSSGNLFVGTTAGSFGAKITAESTTSYNFESRRTGTGNEGHVAFRNANGAVGTIFTNGSSTAYNTSSDARLKDVTGSARGLEVINELNPVAYNWKADGQADEGLIAQEVLDIVPNAVSGSEEEMYQMDYSKLVVHLVAGMKEQQTQIDALQSEINLLKGE